MASDLTVQNLNVNSVNGKAWGSEFFGVDQTWQDVTASRVSDTTYTNSTRKPIMVCISGGTDNVFIENEYTVTADYTIPAGKSAVSVGDANGNVTINSGVTVTVSDGSRWVIL